jgi:hypothetical protein
LTKGEPSIEEGFALMLETACEDFSILQALVNKELQLTPSIKGLHQKIGANRASARIQMALAKSFIAFAVRARRICEHARELRLDRLERARFLKATKNLVDVRDVNEHGFDAKATSRPTLHNQEEGSRGDETSLLISAPTKIYMGPINLHTVYGAVDRMRSLAGFKALRGGRVLCKPPHN